MFLLDSTPAAGIKNAVIISKSQLSSDFRVKESLNSLMVAELTDDAEVCAAAVPQEQKLACVYFGVAGCIGSEVTL